MPRRKDILAAQRRAEERRARERLRKSQISDKALLRQTIDVLRDRDPDQAAAAERKLAELEAAESG